MYSHVRPSQCPQHSHSVKCLMCGRRAFLLPPDPGEGRCCQLVIYCDPLKCQGPLMGVPWGSSSQSPAWGGEPQPSGLGQGSSFLELPSLVQRRPETTML